MSDTVAGHNKIAAFFTGCLLAAAIGWPPAAHAQTQGDALEIEAMAHADTIELAWRTLEAHIERQSTAATSWGGNTPPAAAGWDPDWTLRGLGGRYCDDVLVVFADRPTLKGVGANLRAVRMAPHVRAVSEGRVYPPLHWLASGVAEGELGRASLTLPACMTGLPLNRVALAGRVVDPWGLTSQRIVRRETEDRACPSGQHGAGQTWERPWTQNHNGRGEAIGTELAGTWGIKVNRCRADYTVAELYTVACPGGTGDQVWRRHRTVTSAGETFTVDPTPVSSTCTVSPPPPPPTAVTSAWTSTIYEHRTVGCPSSYTGTGRRMRRTVTRSHESTRWPWDSTATQRLVDVGYSNWVTIANNCARVVSGGQGGGQGGNQGGGQGTGIDVDGDGRTDFDTAQEATQAGFSPSEMSVGFGEAPTGSRPGQNPSRPDGGGNGGTPGGNSPGTGGMQGGHPGGHSRNR